MQVELGIIIIKFNKNLYEPIKKWGWKETCLSMETKLKVLGILVNILAIQEIQLISYDGDNCE